MTRTRFAEGQILFREGDPSDGVFRLSSGTVDVFRELDGEPILLGKVGAGQFIGEMGVVENRPRSATARAATAVEVEILTPTEFLDQIANSPRIARELIRRLSQRLREADDRIVNDERRSGRAHDNRMDPDDRMIEMSADNVYLAAKSPWLQRQFQTPLRLGNLPFVVGRRPVAGERPPLWEPNLMLDDNAPSSYRATTSLLKSLSKSLMEGFMCATSAARLGRLSTANPSAIISAPTMHHCGLGRMR